MIAIDENDDGHWVIYSDGIKVEGFPSLREAQQHCIENNWKIDKINWNPKVTANWGLNKK